MKKTIAAIMLTCAMRASATTITINQATPTALDFTIEWGSPISEYGDHKTGSDGTQVWWMTETSSNHNYYWVEIHDANFPDLHGFGLTFNSDPEYYGPVDTSAARLGIFSSPHFLPLDGDPYGARVVYGSAVPDAGGTGLLLALGMAGVCWAGRRLV